MLGFKIFHSARITLQGIELLHMIKKGQMITVDGRDFSAAEQFYSLAASFRPERVQTRLSETNATQPPGAVSHGNYQSQDHNALYSSPTLFTSASNCLLHRFPEFAQSQLSARVATLRMA